MHPSRAWPRLSPICSHFSDSFGGWICFTASRRARALLAPLLDVGLDERLLDLDLLRDSSKMQSS